MYATVLDIIIGAEFNMTFIADTFYDVPSSIECTPYLFLLHINYYTYYHLWFSYQNCHNNISY